MAEARIEMPEDLQERPPGDEEWAQTPPRANAGDQRPLAGGQQQFLRMPPQQQQWQAPPNWRPYVPPQQYVQPQPQPHKVRLPPFWSHNPRVWFTQAESAFNTCHVGEERLKFDLVVACLGEETLTQVQSVVEIPEQLAHPYQVLKARLLEVYQPDMWEQASRILHFRELGDTKPSQLMDQMLALHPRDEQPGTLFKAVFLDRMPADIRAHVQGLAARQGCRELAAACDVVWHARTSKGRPGTTAAVAEAQEEELVEHVAAMHVQPGKPKGAAGRGKDRGGGRGRGGGKGRGGGRPKGKVQGYTCWKHVQYGDQAWECVDPTICTFSGN